MPNISLFGIGAPSVGLPESVIPSAGVGARHVAIFQSVEYRRFFCLRVSGAVAPSASGGAISPAAVPYCIGAWGLGLGTWMIDARAWRGGNSRATALA
jgi:hypothetical protein